MASIIGKYSVNALQYFKNESARFYSIEFETGAYALITDVYLLYAYVINYLIVATSILGASSK